MASTSSQSKRCESEMVPKRPVMPRDIFDAAMKGDSDVLIERLGLQTRQQTQIQVTENQTVRSELQSATRFGDTVLHLLVTKMHNELALKVFESDTSLLKMQNKMLETPLHCAAKVGNQEAILRFIDIEPALVKDVLQETNEKGDTALHVAVRYDHAHFCRNLMEFDSELAYNVNKEMFSTFHLAIEEEHNFIAEQMLCVDPLLACTQLIDGMFPVHLAARKNNRRMVLYFMKNFPDYVELVDSRGRNLFHFVVEEADKVDFLFALPSDYKGMMTRMNNATDYEGNTPLHIAAMKGHRHTMRFIWKDVTNCNAGTVENKRGLTPYEVSKNQLLEENSIEDSTRINLRILTHELTNGDKFSEEWFMDVMVPPPPPPPPPPTPTPPPPPPFLENRWERTQVIGLGSILITTVTFAAAFTIPGGYNQDNGTPILGRRYMFWAFILADTLAFIQGFLSLFTLLYDALPGRHLDSFEFSATFFLLAANSMVMTFGLGLYVTLSPTCLPIAIIILVITLLIGSPVLLFALVRKKNIKIITSFVYNWTSFYAVYAFSLLFIFCLALLSL